MSLEYCIQERMHISSNRKLGTIGSFILMIVVAAIFYVTTSDWDTPRSASIYYSILAFLMVTMTASTLNIIRSDPSPAHKAFISGTSIGSIFFAGAAVFYIFSTATPVIHTSTAGIFLNLVAYVITGLLIFSFSRINLRPTSVDSIWHRPLIVQITVIIGVILFGGSMVLARLPLDPIVFLTLGYVMGSIAFLCYVFAAINTYKARTTDSIIDSTRLSLSFVLLAAASLTHTLILPVPSSIWILSIGLTAIAFVFAIIATTYPYLESIGVEERLAYYLSILLAAIVILPVIIAKLLEAFVIFTPVPEVGATMLIHLSGAILAGALSFAVYTRSNLKRATYHNPIILLLACWSVSEFALMFSHFNPTYGSTAESLVPYIVGTMASIILLSIAVRRTLNPPQTITWTFPSSKSILGFVLFILGLIVGEIVRPYIPFALEGSQLGRALMLSLSYLALLILLTLVILIAASSGGEFSTDTYAAGSSFIWLVIVVLKADFPIWSAGWWSAELILILSVSMFSLLMLQQYLNESKNAAALESRASQFTQLIQARISRYHASVLETLGEISKSTENEVELDRIAAALADISCADEQIRSIRELVTADRFPDEILESFDLVDAIRMGLKRATTIEAINETILQFDKETGACFVQANSLLIDVFESIFLGVSQRIGALKSIGVEISDDPSTLLCLSRVTIEISTADAKLEEELIKRYTQEESTDVVEFAYARRLVDLYGGQFDVLVQTLSDRDLGVVFSVYLPSSMDERVD
ncbi:MAG: hypothetical protein RTU30_14850 [Candidatus Thorarchaeota archaeon]